MLVLATRYFFRRAIEKDPALFQGLAFAKLEAMGSSQDDGFAHLAELLEGQGGRLDELLGDVLAVAVETRDGVRHMEQQLTAMGRQLDELTARLGMKDRQVQSGDSMSIKTDEERRLVGAMLAKYRGLPEAERRQRPALLSAVARLENAAGDHERAIADFQAVAAMAGDDRTLQGEAHFNAYRAALERAGASKKKEDELATREVALGELVKAINKDRRHLPFDARKYQPRRILGAGGFGVTFLCKRRGPDDMVAVKSLSQENLGRDMGEVLKEGQLLGQLDHPAIIRMIDCDYVDPDTRSAPYLVMAFFEGPTLEEYVKEGRPLPVEEAVALFRLIAQGFQAAHAKGVWHRDIKPANLLVRREAGDWRAKIIDFGLALRRDLTAAGMAASTARQGKSVLGESIAGTAHYAAPEQMDVERQKEIGPWSDVFGFGKTCYYALFGTPTPDDDDKDTLPDALKRLLSRCNSQAIAKRPQNFDEVVAQLVAIEKVLVRAVEPVDVVEEVTEGEPPAVQWHYAAGGQTKGPIGEEALRSLIASGKVSPSDGVWRPGLAAWVPANSVEGLAPKQSASPPPLAKVADVVFFMEKGWAIASTLAATFSSDVLKVYLDEAFLGETPAKSGFEYHLKLSPGTHTIQVVKWSSQGELCRKEFPVALGRAGKYDIRFNYVWTPPNPIAGFFGGEKGNHIDKSTIDIVKQP